MPVSQQRCINNQQCAKIAATARNECGDYIHEYGKIGKLVHTYIIHWKADASAEL